MRTIDDIRMAARLLTGLRAFLAAPQSAEACRRRIEGQYRRRDASFLRLVERGIYRHARSPYRPLLEHAGIELGDIAALVRQDGVEGALGRLYDAGVRITLDEFKGRRPVTRGLLDLPVTGTDFDNPLLARHYETRTSGSRGAGSRLNIDLDLIAHEACYDRVSLDAFDLGARPKVIWRPAPPGSSGLKNVLRLARLGHPVSRWFSQTPVGSDWKNAILVHSVAAAGYLYGTPLARPFHVPLGNAVAIARWLAARRAEGTPAMLDTTVSSAVRLCTAAAASRLDVAGTFFRVGGESLSPARMEIIASAGVRAVCHYAMAEAGRIAHACADAEAVDDVHVAVDKMALLQRDVPHADATRPGFVVTTLMETVPRIMLNVEIGDEGVLVRRTCGCPWNALGFTLHLHGIRSYEKLTSEGMHFVGADLIELLERTLPARFGGAATDYQIVENEEAGLLRVSLFMSPRIGPANEEDVRAVMLTSLASKGPANRMMAQLWQSGGTIRVVRQEPQATAMGKILPWHVVRSREARR